MQNLKRSIEELFEEAGIVTAKRMALAKKIEKLLAIAKVPPDRVARLAWRDRNYTKFSNLNGPLFLKAVWGDVLREHAAAFPEIVQERGDGLLIQIFQQYAAKRRYRHTSADGDVDWGDASGLEFVTVTSKKRMPSRGKRLKRQDRQAIS